jgi:hypothetical protein
LSFHSIRKARDVQDTELFVLYLVWAWDARAIPCDFKATGGHPEVLAVLLTFLDAINVVPRVRGRGLLVVNATLGRDFRESGLGDPVIEEMTILIHCEKWSGFYCG